MEIVLDTGFHRLAFTKKFDYTDIFSRNHRL
jgi:hypothetical protein